MKFAVIETGGKQYVVEPGTTITIEKLPGDIKKGDSIAFDKVLLLEDDNGIQIGAPTVPGAVVAGTLAESGRSKKLTIVKFRPKSRYTRKQGHRQAFMKVTIAK